MPTPARTSLAEIVRTARTIVETDGLDALTMQRVAAAVGVRAPSLYKHVASRDGLIRLVAEAAIRDLAGTLEAAAASGDAAQDLAALARAFRRFGHANPGTYGLLFGRLPADARPDPGLSLEASRPVLRVVGELGGDERALEGARTVVAWVHGFVSMELAGAFRLGGDVEAAFDFGIASLTRAISRVGG